MIGSALSASILLLILEGFRRNAKSNGVLPRSQKELIGGQRTDNNVSYYGRKFFCFDGVISQEKGLQPTAVFILLYRANNSRNENFRHCI